MTKQKTGSKLVLPDRFIERYRGLVDDPDAFFESLTTYPPKAFRVNTLKANADEVKEQFESYGIKFRQMSWYKDAFISDDMEANATLEHFLGKIYMQELPSMLPPLLVRTELEIQNPELVIDACAAPGSKTTQLAAIMQNQGTLVANDLDYTRIKALKYNVEKVGAYNTIITNQDFRFFPNLGPEVILLDAPCSAEGTIRKHAEAAVFWNEKRIAGHAGLQRALILHAYEILRPGGAMVYSTCTFAPEEDEAVVDFLLERKPEAVIEPIDVPGFRLSPAVKEWNGKTFSPKTLNTKRIWPHHNDTGGFFLAKIRKPLTKADDKTNETENPRDGGGTR